MYLTTETKAVLFLLLLFGPEAMRMETASVEACEVSRDTNVSGNDEHKGKRNQEIHVKKAGLLDTGATLGIQNEVNAADQSLMQSPLDAKAVEMQPAMAMKEADNQIDRIEGGRLNNQAVQAATSVVSMLQVNQNAQTNAAAQREALDIFLQTFQSWRVTEPGTAEMPFVVDGAVPSFECEGQTYTGEVKGISAGKNGVTVLMHRGAKDGPKVVVKLSLKLDSIDPNLEHECKILRLLQDKGVPNTLSCEALCEQHGRSLIVVTPFVEDAHGNFWGHMEETELAFFNSAGALRRAVHDTLTTGWAMLEAGVINRDQSHNILYSRDGRVTFIDMGFARTIPSEDLAVNDIVYFISIVLEKAPWFFMATKPRSFVTEWNGTLGEEPKKISETHEKRFFSGPCQFAEVLQEVGLPLTPEYLKNLGLDLAEMIKQLVDEGRWYRYPGMESEEQWIGTGIGECPLVDWTSIGVKTHTI